MIQTLAMPAQVMLPVPGVRPLYPQDPSALAQATKYCCDRTQVSCRTGAPARAASWRAKSANWALELSPIPPPGLGLYVHDPAPGPTWIWAASSQATLRARMAASACGESMASASVWRAT